MTDIFVVNLEHSVERKEYISAQLDSMPVKYEMFPAVNGHESRLSILDMYDDGLSQAYRSKSLTKGQIGCYASHYLLWQKCVELNKPIIVIEDDIAIDKKRFIEFYDLVPELDSKYEFVRLSAHRRRKARLTTIETIGNLSIHRASKGHMSTMGYFLTPNGAKKFLKYSTAWYMAVDIYMDRFWIHGAEPFGLEPPCVSEDIHFESDIGYEKNASRSLSGRLRRETFNLSETTKRAVHNIKFRYYNR